MDEAEGGDLEVAAAAPSSFHGRTYAGKGVSKRLARATAAARMHWMGVEDQGQQCRTQTKVMIKPLMTYIDQPYV